MKFFIQDDSGVTTELVPASGDALPGGASGGGQAAGEQKAVVGNPSGSMVSPRGDPVPATLANLVSLYHTQGGSGELQVNVSPEDRGVVTADFGPAAGHNYSDATATINGVPIPARSKILNGKVTLALNHSAPDAITLTTGSNKVAIVGYQPGAESAVQFTRQP